MAKVVRTKERSANASNESDIFTMSLKKQTGLIAIKEHKFDDVRKWKFDYAILSHRIAIEVEGGVFKKRSYKSKSGELITTIGGRHNSSDGFMKDMEKYNQAAVLGWRLIRTTPNELITLKTFETILKASLCTPK